MKPYIKQLFIFMAATALAFGGCRKDDSADPDKSDPDGKGIVTDYEPGNIPGMGETEGELTGEPFDFPEKIEIKGGLKGDLFLVPAKDYCQIIGSGAFVLVQLELVNHLEKDTLLVLPAGLTFRAMDEQDQNGLLIQEAEISLAGGETCKTLVYLYCINQHKSGSSGNSRYAFGPVSDASPVVELMQLLKGKRINFEHLDNEEFQSLKHDLQYIVWNVTDGSGITQEDRDFIRALPTR